MPQSIPKGLVREYILGALADLDAGTNHPFGVPTEYELVHEGKRYPPKAVVGLAFRHLRGTVLMPEDFSGGEAPGQANFVPGTWLHGRKEGGERAFR
jgi:5-methylcytosine-specific restriction protein A